MDYTQNGTTGKNDGFNPSGFSQPGTTIPGENTSEQYPGGQVDILKDPLERNPQQIGNMVISAGEDSQQPDFIPDQPAPSYMPPSTESDVKDISKGTGSDNQFDFANIKVTGDRLSKAAVKEVEKAEHDLLDKGDVSGFYKEARKMMEENLKNSYGREVGK